MVSLYKDKIPLETQDLGLWEGDIATLLPSNNEPTLKWKGAPLPAAFFGQMLGFFRHAVTTWDSEAMVRLAYNPEIGAWKIMCLPQTVKTGMEVKEIHAALTPAQQALRETHTAPLRQGYMENGSSHSHCNASAFQSGTDSANELKNTGVHITLGNVMSENPSVHGRVVFRGVQYPINWAEWFEGWPEKLDGHTDTFTLLPGEDMSFPKEWLDCCFEPPAAPEWPDWRSHSPRYSNKGSGAIKKPVDKYAGWWEQNAGPAEGAFALGDDIGYSAGSLVVDEDYAKLAGMPLVSVPQQIAFLEALCDVSGATSCSDLVAPILHDWLGAEFCSETQEDIRAIILEDGGAGLDHLVYKMAETYIYPVEKAAEALMDLDNQGFAGEALRGLLFYAMDRDTCEALFPEPGPVEYAGSEFP